MTSDSHVDVQEPQELFLPNKMGRIVLLALEELMGRNGLNGVLSTARLQHLVDSYPPNDLDKEFPFSSLSQLLQALEEMYGVRSGRGLARKAGQGCFRLGIQDFAPVLGIVDMVLRILPLRMCMKIGLEVLAETFNRFTDQRVSIHEDDGHFRWTVPSCPICHGRLVESPCCHLMIGVLEEELFWVSGGRTFYLEEVSCIGTGDDCCTILIGQRPLE